MSDHEDDHAVMHHASFLRPAATTAPAVDETALSASTASLSVSPSRPASPPRTTSASAQPSDATKPRGDGARESNNTARGGGGANGDNGEEEEEGDDDDDDDDERPREVPARQVPQPSPFVQSQQQPPPPPPPPMMDEHLRVSAKCRATKCFRLQWEAEMNPRCREKTALNVEGKIHLFDGFYVICHDDPPEVPQFEYTRGGVMCKIQFVREDLPAMLCPTPERHHAMFLLQRYLFQQLLGIQTAHLFQQVFADPSRATGDPGDICSDYHLIPRFISITDQPLLHKQDLLAPHRIGYAIGKLLPVEHVLGCLEASTKYSLTRFLETVDSKAVVDSIVSTRINGVPRVFRVDELVYEVLQQPQAGADASEQAKTRRRVVQLKHIGTGAPAYDGAKSKKRIRKWQELGGSLMQISPRVERHEQVLTPEECHLTGMRTDVFEFGSAMPMILKYIRNYKLLASFEAEMRLTFKDKALLRQAFTHGSYIDAGMQNVNTVEATVSRVALGHVFEHVDWLKRKRSSFLDDEGVQNTNTNKDMDPEMKKIADQHLTAEFKPEFHSKFLCPYERLEFLGDAVLSFLVASSAFLKHQTFGEGQLHQTRVDVANNNTLGRIARSANFEMLMLTAFDLKTVSESVKTKIAADCFEALLGAVYKDQGIEACRQLLINLMTLHDPDIRELYLLTTDELAAKASAYITTDHVRFQQHEQKVQLKVLHRRFTAATGVAVQNTALWLQCVTHNSFKAPQIDDGEFVCSDPSYERIEFLGDAVLQLLSSEFLVSTFPNHQEHLLTQARSSLVKNTRLAVVARDMGYEPYIRLGNEVKKSGNLYTEDVLADVFESLLGAVFLENVHDLNAVRTILEATLFPRIKEAIERREWMNPRKVLTHHLTQWSRGRRQPIDCAFKKLPSTDGTQHCVALLIDRHCVSRGAGRTIHAAQDAACRRALQLYGIKMHD